MVTMITRPEAYHINKMLQSIPHDPQLCGMLLTDPEKAFDRFGLTEAERVPFRNQDADGIRALGIHPHLMMPWTILTLEHARNHLCIDPAHKAQLSK